MEISVYEGQKAVEEARRVAKEEDRADGAAVLAKFARTHYCSRQERIILKGMGSAGVEALLKVVNDSHGTCHDRLNAAMLLAEWDVPGWLGVLERAMESVMEAREVAEVMGDVSYWLQSRGEAHLAEIRASPIMWRCALKWYRMARMRWVGAHLCASLQVPVAERCAGVPWGKLDNAELAAELKAGVPGEVWEVAMPRVSKKPDDFGEMWEGLGKGSMGLERGVVDTLVEAALKMLWEPGNSAGVTQRDAMRFVMREHAEGFCEIGRLAAGAPNVVVRGWALELVGEVDEGMARRIALGMARDPAENYNRVSGCKVLAKVSAGTGDAEAMEALGAVRPTEYDAPQVVRALLAVGGEAAVAKARKYLGLLDRNELRLFAPLCLGWNEERVVARMKELGIVRGEELAKAEAWAKGEGRGAMTREETWWGWWEMLFTALGRYWMVPVNREEWVDYSYRELFEQVAELGCKVFPAEAIVQLSAGDEAGHPEGLLQFVMGERVYRFAPRHFPRHREWLDLPGIAGTVNRALRESGMAERLVVVGISGVFGRCVVAPAGAFAKLAEEMGWPAVETLRAAELAGEEYAGYLQGLIGEPFRQLCSRARAMPYELM